MSSIRNLHRIAVLAVMLALVAGSAKNSEAAYSLLYPYSTYSELRADGQYHYGVLYAIPQVGRFASVPGGWDLEYKRSYGRYNIYWLLIPRTWLIREGYLRPWAALHPERRYSIWGWSSLRRRLPAVIHR